MTALMMTEAGPSPEPPGQQVDADVSRFESLVALLQYPWIAAQVPQHNPYVLPQVCVPGLERAADGWVCAVAVTPPQWTGFKAMAGVGDLEDPRFDTLPLRVTHREEVTELVRGFTSAHTVDELVELGARHRVPITPVGTASNLPTLVPYAERNVYVPSPCGFLQPRSPFRYSATHEDSTRAAGEWQPEPPPQVGQHDEAGVVGRRQRPGTTSGDPRRPLAGLRVLELGTFQAGPLVGVNLAALGADVVKVEAVGRPDLIRFTGNLDVDRAWERHAAYLAPNLRKRSLTVDFTQPEGLRTVRELIARSDVLLENFLPRVLDDRGLGYEDVRQIRPDIVMVRLPAWGSTGAWRDRPGFTYSVNATCGLSDLTGYGDGDPLLTGTIVDPVAAMYSTTATLAALRQRQLTGRGGLVEVSLCDVAAQLTAGAVVVASATGLVPHRTGNDCEHRAPQGFYACADGTWLSVSVGTQAQWAALTDLPEASAWAKDARFGDLRGRLAHRAELDERLTALCADHPAEALATQLRSRGVPAAPLGVGEDVVANPQLLARGRVFELPHAVVGPVRYVGPPARYAAHPVASVPLAAPLFGEHNAEILRELGHDAAAVQAMVDDGAIGDAPYGLAFTR